MVKGSAAFVIIKNGIKWILKWIITSAVGKAVIKNIMLVAFMAMFVSGLAAAGALPQSPFRHALPMLNNLAIRIPYLEYVSFFIPVIPIMGLLGYWLGAVVSFHIIKIFLRKAKIIK